MDPVARPQSNPKNSGKRAWGVTRSGNAAGQVPVSNKYPRKRGRRRPPLRAGRPPATQPPRAGICGCSHRPSGHFHDTGGIAPQRTGSVRRGYRFDLSQRIRARSHAIRSGLRKDRTPGGTDMELTYWWILPLAALALVIAARLLIRRRPQRGRPVAHGERLTYLPEYQKALRRSKATLVLAMALGAVFLAATATAAARPVQRTTEQPEIRNRDIILCLDVSGSMTSTNRAIAKVFQELAREFDGERIGMVIFDSSSVQLFPLTDDYDYAAEQLTTAQKALDSGAGSFFDGTWNGGGSSPI